MIKTFIKKITVFLLIASMFCATQGMMVFAESIDALEDNKISIAVDNDGIVDEKTGVSDSTLTKEEFELEDDVQISIDDTTLDIGSGEDVFGDADESENAVYLLDDWFDKSGASKDAVKKITISKGKNIDVENSWVIGNYFLSQLPYKLYGYFDETTGEAFINSEKEDNIITLEQNDSNVFNVFPNVCEIKGLGNLDTHAFTGMSNWFAGLEKLTSIDIEDLDVTSLMFADKMFYGCKSLKDIDFSHFNNAYNANGLETDFESMFEGCGFEKVDLTGLNLYATNNMFANCEQLKEVKLGGANIDSWTTAKDMFKGCDLEKIDLTGLDFDKFGANNLFDVDKSDEGEANTKLVLDNITFANKNKVKSLFENDNYLSHINELSMNDVKLPADSSDLLSKFTQAETLSIDNIDVTNVINYSNILANLDKLNKITISEELSKKMVEMGLTGKWQNVDTNKVFDLEKSNPTQQGTATYIRYEGEMSVEGKIQIIPKDFYKVIPYTNKEDIVKITFTKELEDTYLQNKYLLKPMSYWGIFDFDDNGLYMYYDGTGCVVFSCEEQDTMKIEDLKQFFSGYTKLTTVKGWENVDTSSVKDMSYMFNCCKSLIDADFENLDTSSLLNAQQMFAYCESLKNVDFSNFNPNKNCIKLDFLFYNSGIEKVTMYGLDNCTRMNYAFSRCSNLAEVDFSHANTSTLTDITELFNECKNLKKVNFNGCDLSAVSHRTDMFYENNSMEYVDFSNAKFPYDSSYFFSRLPAKTILVDNADTSKTEVMKYMFYSCRNLEKLDLSSFDTSKVTDMFSIIYTDYNLKELNISGFDFTKTKSKISFNVGELVQEGDKFVNKNENAVPYVIMDGIKFDNKNNINMLFKDSDIMFNITKLDFNDVKLLADSSELLAHLPELEELSLDNVDVSNVTKINNFLTKSTKLNTITLGKEISTKVKEMNIGGYWQDENTGKVYNFAEDNLEQDSTVTYKKVDGSYASGGGTGTEGQSASGGGSGEEESTKKEYIKVQFRSGDGGTGNMADQEVEKGVSTALNANEFTKEGHQFSHWVDLEGNEINDKAEVVYNEDMILYAVWESLTPIVPIPITPVNRRSSSGGGGGGGGGSAGGGGGSSSLLNNQNVQIANQIAQANNTTAETKVQTSLATAPVNYNTANSTWAKDANGTWSLEVVNANGQKEKATNTWACINNELSVNGHSVKVSDFYYFDNKGQMLTGWLSDNTGNKYYLDTEEKNLGKMCRGWKQVGTDYYYLGTDGKLVTNSATQDGHIVDATGRRGQ